MLTYFSNATPYSQNPNLSFVSATYTSLPKLLQALFSITLFLKGYQWNYFEYPVNLDYQVYHITGH